MRDKPFTRKAGDPRFTAWPHGRDWTGKPATVSRPEVAITHRGVELRVFFQEVPADRFAEPKVQEVRLVPVDSDSLEANDLRWFTSHAELYLASARATLMWQTDNLIGAVEVLRRVGRPGRGHGDDFYRAIAEHYRVLAAQGPHPVKRLGQEYNVTISAASRWLTVARQRGYLEADG